MSKKKILFFNNRIFNYLKSKLIININKNFSNLKDLIMVCNKMINMTLPILEVILTNLTNKIMKKIRKDYQIFIFVQKTLIRMS